MFNRRAVFSFAAVAVVALAGCVERKEHLTILPSGSVLYLATFRSDSLDDLYERDAVPRRAGGWLAEQQVEKDDDGKETYTLTANGVFPAGAKLPANFAIKTDADADLYLQFPTALTIERRGDGTYFHFSRTYQARPWANVAALEERLVQAPLSELKDLNPDKWTPAQREMVARAMSSFEMEKMLLFARAAFREATPEVPQDGWLAVQEDMRDCLIHLDYRRIAKLLEPQEMEVEDEMRERAVKAEIEGFIDLLSDQMKQALFTRAGYNGRQYDRFMVEFDRQKKAHEITEDLADDKFEITVEMPGTIVASNAESVDSSKVRWSFDGQIVRDKQLELLVTSRVGK